jgi:hypothetical protein
MSFKLIDQTKKNPAMPSRLKRVFEAYLSFGNKDGTQIRPTERKVAERAGVSRRTASRRTTELVRLGFLVHDLNEDGSWATFTYKKHGVWAYVYHADLSPLDNLAVLEQFERERVEKFNNLSAAGLKSAKSRKLRNQQNGSDYFETKGYKQGGTNWLKQGETKGHTDPTLYTPSGDGDIDPRFAHPTDHPSAVSTAVEEKEVKSEVVPSVAPLPQEVGRSSTENLIRAARSKTMLDKETQSRLLEHLVTYFGERTSSSPEALGHMYDCFHAAIAKYGVPAEHAPRFLWHLLEYNRTHQKKDGYIIRGPEKLAKALWSDNEDNLVSREAQHDDGTCPVCSKLGMSARYEKFEIPKPEPVPVPKRLCSACAVNEVAKGDVVSGDNTLCWTCINKDIEENAFEPTPKLYNTQKLTPEEIGLFRLRMPKQEDRDQVIERNKSGVWKPYMVSAAMHLVLERVGDGETIGFEHFADLMDMVNADFTEQAA